MDQARAALAGAASALAGVLLVESLARLGVPPFAPIGWPAVGMLAAGALWGAYALCGGAAVVVLCYAANAMSPERFPEFFYGVSTRVSWLGGLLVLSAAALVLHTRLRRAESAATLAVKLRESHDALNEARERLEKALDGSSVALWDTDLRTGRVYLSEAWSQIMGVARAETVVHIDELFGLMHPDDVEPARRASIETMKGLRPSYAAEHRVHAPGGEWRWILSRGRVTERDPQTGKALRMIGTNLDITDRKRIEEALQSVAQSDPLTGVANRVVLMDRLGLALSRARRNASQAAVLYVDIDGFKQINDSLGHAAGDALLKAFAARLAACVRATDTVARVGGDEFVVLLEDVKETGSAIRVAQKILDAVHAPVPLDREEIMITTSIGIAQGAAEDEGALLKRADAALYEAKAGGRNTFRVAAQPAAQP
jgi:diguanylate cyclase (GGDEF)-like protein/PAS domain S-box-containing protein